MEPNETNAGLLMEKQYRIPFELFREGFTAFQKRFVYPRSYAVMAVFLIVAGIYGYLTATAEEGANTPLYCMIILFCLVMAGMQWYNPRKIRRSLMEGVREIADDQYRLRIYPEYLEIGTMLPPEDSAESDALFDDTPEEDFTGTRIYYNKGLHVAEYDRFYMIYQTKTMFYVVPKEAFSAEEQEVLRVHFSQKLEKNFFSGGAGAQPPR